MLLRLIRQAVRRHQYRVEHRDVGTVQHIGSGVATISGLRQAGVDELVEFPTGVRGMVLTLDHDRVHAILLGSDEGVHGGDLVTASGGRLRIPVGADLAGRVITPLGEPIDGRGLIEASDEYLLERDAPGIVDRRPVHRPLHTGLKVIDALLPIGCGQRELIVGNRQTGKTALAIDAILNQRETKVYCIYVAIGQKSSSTLSVIRTLRTEGALEYTTVVVSSPDDPPALRYLAPYAGCSIAEYMTHQLKRDTLVVYDDLNRHADAYRELSLLLRRPPGREAYPGDIFYLHARLLERAGQLSADSGGGSLSALPIVELQRGNISSYIPTNLISITDGQIVLDGDLFNKNVKPAVDIGLSVSRVGGAAQTPAMRKVAGRIRLELAQYDEVARFARFGTDLDEHTRRQIRRGQRLQNLLTQPVNRPMSLGRQVAVLYAAGREPFEDVPPEEARAYEQRLVEFLEDRHLEILNAVQREGRLEGETAAELEEALEEFDRSAEAMRE
ncbi:MAG: F0F1 ATP synthase subunit alpha [Anaerolineales bacterium]|nr:F0F1 ATP synthase subunit alpha [Anaerolineales bacterium]